MATTTEQQLSCGRMLGCVANVRDASNSANTNEFDFISCCVTHPRCAQDLSEKPTTLVDIDRADLDLTTTEWSRHIVGEVAPWIDVDSSDAYLRKMSEKELGDEFSCANYLSLTVHLVPLKSDKFANLARMVNDFMKTNSTVQIWLHIPASLPSRSPESNGDTDSTPSIEEEEDPWQWWNTFRSMCDNNKKLYICLEIPCDLPDSQAAYRWYGEPVRCITVDTQLFLTNKSDKPVLSRAHQRFIHGFFKLGCQVLLSGTPVAPEGRSLKEYKTYLDWLWKQQPENDTYTTFAAGYEDYLQMPLQPLADHLESQIYEVFEKDPVKYTQYENAIEKALTDRKTENVEDYVVTVMVLGAGRGPLVTATLRAAKTTNCKVRVFAVEKNPNAVITLRRFQSTTWKESSVEIVHCDMRKWNPDVKTDLMISELLGSFGDNELSPECLDGAQRLLKDDAISIPSEYTSFVVPVQSERLWNQVRDHVGTNIEEAFDNGYVVRVHNRFELGVSKELFTFAHPNDDLTDPFSNDRHKEVTFEAKQNCVIHGIVGYFEATLYKDVKISTKPQTHSPGMFSWFPIFFPLREPVMARRLDNISINFWRIHDSTKVWYEWCLTKPQGTPIQNSLGKTYAMQLF